jgi:hypothetical protein
MSSIKSVLIPRIEKKVDAEFIANVFSRNGIAEVSRVYIEPIKSSMTKRVSKYNCAYISIKFWHETKIAQNFIQRLQNPHRETRVVYNADDNWWVVKINKDLAKLDDKKNVLTIFCEKEAYMGDELSLKAVADEDEILDNEPDIDYNKTKILKEVIANLKTNDDDLEDFARYLDEMEKGRNLWYSEQYIYDALEM